MVKESKWKYRVAQQPKAGTHTLYGRLVTIPHAHALVTKIAQRRNIVESLDENTSEGYTTAQAKERDIFEKIYGIISAGIAENKLVIVCGDYDVDGMTSTALMYSALTSIGCKHVDYCVPNRLTAGYGIDMEALDIKAHTTKPQDTILITVDNGIGEKDKVEILKKKGYTVIVTDHHLPEDKVPDCIVYNTKMLYTEEHDEYVISGCGAARRLAEYLYIRTNPEKLPISVIAETYHSFWSILEAMSIISDVIELNSLTRTRLKEGLVHLQLTQHDGLIALLTLCGFKRYQPISATYLAYSVIPKLNAAGRMGSPDLGVKLLLMEQDKTPGKSSTLLTANGLIELNNDRKTIENRIYEESIEIADELYKTKSFGMVVYKPDWHPGVLGIIAARLVERYGIPIVVMTDDRGTIKGSGRGVDGFDLFSSLSICKDDLIQFGGHMAAAGCETDAAHLENFRNKFNTTCREMLETTEVIYEVDTDVPIPVLHDVRFQIGLRVLEPYGSGNPEPILRLNNIKVLFSEMRRDSLAIVAVDSENNGIYLSKYRPPDEWKVQVGTVMNVLVSPIPLYFSGSTTMEWRIRDMKILSTPSAHKSDDSYDYDEEE